MYTYIYILYLYLSSLVFYLYSFIIIFSIDQFTLKVPDRERGGRGQGIGRSRGRKGSDVETHAVEKYENGDRETMSSPSRENQR